MTAVTSQTTNASPGSIIDRVIEFWPASASISPSRVADIAYKEPEIDPENIAPILARHLATMKLRDYARQQLGKKHDLGDEIAEQHELFPNLQRRYPKAKGPQEDPEYIPLENLSAEDISANLAHLRTSAASRLRHADALEQWAIEHGRI